jgi:hypothetical protein
MTRKKITFRLARFISHTINRLAAYIRRFLFPLYLFPFKLVTYSIYYLSLFLGSSLLKLLTLMYRAILWPFQGWGNLGKTLFWLGLFAYFAFTEMRFAVLVERFGGYGKFLCSEWLTTYNLKSSVVRIVGGLSEGSGFFVSNTGVLTSFHVIADEPSPKVIFADGSFTTPVSITGNKDADLALLVIREAHPDKVFEFSSPFSLTPNEPLLSAGYALGTDLPGDVTIGNGIFVSIRKSKSIPTDILQTTISLVDGMSGGPVVDQCGDVVGINMAGVSGTSFFVSSDSIRALIPQFTDQDIAKINVDPSLSPEEAVRAFYTYLKARRMPEGFALLSAEYLQKTNFNEWTTRFTDILDVQVIDVWPADREDTAFIKFGTKNWVDGEVDLHYFEGTWQTVFEDGVYKMLSSNIKEVENPEYWWFSYREKPEWWL